MTIRQATIPLFWIFLVLVFLVATSPVPPQLLEDFSDKSRHILAFLLLATLAKFAYPRVALGKLAAGLLIYGALIEVVQAIPRLHRDASFADWIADAIAVTAVLVIAELARRWMAQRVRA